MREVREELDLGIITSVPGCAKGIEAKVRIAELLGIEIAGVNRLKEKMKF
jgi:dimethylamine--corrinoid protein Co-methyltransferase